MTFGGSLLRSRDKLTAGGDALTERDRRPSRSASSLPAGADDDALASARLRLAVARQVLREAVGAELEALGDGAQLALEARGERRARATVAFSPFAARAALAANVRTSGAPSEPLLAEADERRASRPGCRPSVASDSDWSRLPVNSSFAASLASAPPSAASIGLSAGGSVPGFADRLQNTDDEDVGGEIDRRLRRQLDIEGHRCAHYARGERSRSRSVEASVARIPEPPRLRKRPGRTASR